MGREGYENYFEGADAVAQALPGTADLAEKSGPGEMASGGGQMVAGGEKMAAIVTAIATAGVTATAAADAVQPLSLRQRSTQHNPRIAGKH